MRSITIFIKTISIFSFIVNGIAALTLIEQNMMISFILYIFTSLLSWLLIKISRFVTRRPIAIRDSIQRYKPERLFYNRTKN